MRVVPRLVLTLFVVFGACAAPAAAKEGDSLTVGYSNIAGDELGLWVAESGLPFDGAKPVATWPVAASWFYFCFAFSFLPTTSNFPSNSRLIASL